MKKIYYSVICNLELRNNFCKNNWTIMLQSKRSMKFNWMTEIKRNIEKFFY